MSDIFNTTNTPAGKPMPTIESAALGAMQWFGGWCNADDFEPEWDKTTGEGVNDDGIYLDLCHVFGARPRWENDNPYWKHPRMEPADD